MSFRATVCPHDCPSCCALEVDIVGERIGTVRGAAANGYTAGVICAKVARYAEREHHPDRLTTPLLRTGAKGSGQFRPISAGTRRWTASPRAVHQPSPPSMARRPIWPY